MAEPRGHRRPAHAFPLSESQRIRESRSEGKRENRRITWDIEIMCSNTENAW